MNNINLLSPKIGFPIVYLAINLIALESISNRVFIVLLLFYSFYFMGIFSCQNIYKIKYSNRLNLDSVIFSSRNYVSSTLFKYCAIFYCLLVVVQFFRIGINHMDTFRSIWLRDIPWGTYVVVPVSLGTQVFIYLLTIRYLRKKISLIHFLLVSAVLYGSVFLLGSRSAVSIFLFIQLSLFYLAKRVTTNQMLILVLASVFSMMIVRIFSFIYGDENNLKYFVDTGLINLDSSWESIINTLIHTFSDIAFRTQTIIDNVPEIFDHTYGKSLFFSYCSILPGEQTNVTVLLNHYLFFGSTADVGYPPTIMAQIYLDFGYIGLMVFPFIIGYLYMYVFNKMRKTGRFVYIFLYLLLTYQLLLSCYGEFLTFSIFLFVLIYIFIASFRSILNFNKYK